MGAIRYNGIVFIIAMGTKFTIECFKCHTPLTDNQVVCACNQSPYYNYATLRYDYENASAQFTNPSKLLGLARFSSVLPNESFDITLGEGNTPLLHFKRFGARIGAQNLFVKNETTNPTGCFKDRESAVGINLSREKKIKKIAVVSSGNAAVSAAAYSNVAGIDCICHIPVATSAGKKRLLEIFGAKLFLEPGEYEDIYRKIIDENSLDDETENFTSGINIYKEEGNKTIAFELFERLGVPDTLVMPIGNGALLYGVYKGFWELKQMGVTESIPRMVGVEIAGFAPVAEAIRQGKDHVSISEVPHSIAEAGIAAQESYAAPKAIEAITQTGGQVVEITDADLVVALKQLLADESFLVEPTSLAPFAALTKMSFASDEKIVCVATGNAFKNLEEILHIVRAN